MTSNTHLLETTKLKVNFNTFYFLGFCNYCIGFLFSSWALLHVFCLILVFEKKPLSAYALSGWPVNSLLLTNPILKAVVMKPSMVLNLYFSISLHICLSFLSSSTKMVNNVKEVNWFITVLYIFCTTCWTIKLKIYVSIVWLSNLGPWSVLVSFPIWGACVTRLLDMSYDESLKSVSL